MSLDVKKLTRPRRVSVSLAPPPPSLPSAGEGLPARPIFTTFRLEHPKEHFTPQGSQSVDFRSKTANLAKLEDLGQPFSAAEPLAGAKKGPEMFQNVPLMFLVAAASTASLEKRVDAVAEFARIPSSCASP